LPAARRVGFTLKSCFAAAPASSAPSLRHDLPTTFALRFATFAHTRALPAADSPVLRTLTRSATARLALTRLVFGFTAIASAGSPAGGGAAIVNVTWRRASELPWASIER